MTDYAFTGNATDSTSFTPTLDGETYTVATWWNIAGQRWFFTITSSSGDIVLSRPLVGSPSDTDINLLFGVFTDTTMVWKYSDGVIRVVAA